MKIYFAGSIRGGRDLQPIYKECINLLKDYGTVLSEHVGEEELNAHGETEIEMANIHDRELGRVAVCDVVVAEVTLPSLGVGYIVANARRWGKRVIALYRGDPTFKLTGMFLGNKGLEIYSYQTVADLKKIFQKHLVQSTGPLPENRELKPGATLLQTMKFLDGLTSLRDYKYLGTLEDKVDHLALGGGDMGDTIRQEIEGKITNVEAIKKYKTITAQLTLRVFAIINLISAHEPFVEAMQKKYPAGKKDGPPRLPDDQHSWSVKDWQGILS